MFTRRKSKPTPREQGSSTSSMRYPHIATILEESLKALDLERHALVPPQCFLCPYSGLLMTDPVIVFSTGVTYDRSSIKRISRAGDANCNVTKDYIEGHYVGDVTTRKLIERWCRQTNYQPEQHTDLHEDQEQHLSTSPKYDTDHDSPSASFIFAPSLNDHNYDSHSLHHVNVMENVGHNETETEPDSPSRLFHTLFSNTKDQKDQKVAARRLRKLSDTLLSAGDMTNLNKIVWLLIRGDLMPGVEKELLGTLHNLCLNVDAHISVEDTPELYMVLFRGLQSENEKTKENSLLALFRLVAASEDNLISFYHNGLLETLLIFYDNNKEQDRFCEIVVRITRNLFNCNSIMEEALRSELIKDLANKLSERVQLEPVTEILLSLLGDEDANDQIRRHEVVHMLYCVQYEVENPRIKLGMLTLILEIVKQFENHPQYLSNLRESEKEYKFLRNLTMDSKREISQRAKQICSHLASISHRRQQRYT